MIAMMAKTITQSKPDLGDELDGLRRSQDAVAKEDWQGAVTAMQVHEQRVRALVDSLDKPRMVRVLAAQRQMTEQLIEARERCREELQRIVLGRSAVNCYQAQLALAGLGNE